MVRMFDDADGEATGVPGPSAHVVEPASLSDAELVRAVADAEARGRALDAERVRLAAEVAHRSRRELGTERLSARLACRNAHELIQRATGVAAATASRRVRLGLATRADRGITGTVVGPRFPAVAAALAAGAIGVDAAHAIVTGLEPTLRVAGAADVAKAESELVAAATERWGDRRDAADDEPADDEPADDEPADESADESGSPRAAGHPVLDADDVRLQVRVWAEYLDPDGGAPDERDEERRFLTLHRPRRGLVPVSGLLLPQVASALRAYTDAWTNPRTEPVPGPTGLAAADGAGTDGAGTDTSGTDRAGTNGAGTDTSGTDRAGTDGAGTDRAGGTETRSRAQVMHDVLATALNVAARAADAPSVAGNAPTLVVVAREEDLRTGTGTARTGDGTVVSIATARHTACAGAIQRVSIDGGGRVVGLWSPERCFTGAQRRAIAVRDGGCVIPGCHVPAGWCEVHHVVPHADDPGGTHVDNGVLLCWHHHRTIDTSGWAIRMLDGLPWVRPPSWLDRTGGWRPARPDRRRRGA
jgi:hypothetical protein